MDHVNGEMSSTSNHQNNNTGFTVDLPNSYDAEYPELDEIDDKKNVVKSDVLNIVLSKYGDHGSKLEEYFRLYDIDYRDLAALSDNDLKQFGVVDAVQRRILLDDFSTMVNQNDHYDTELNELNLEEYGFDGLDNIRNHLNYLELGLAASLLTLRLHSTEDVYVSDELNASELVLNTLEEMKITFNSSSSHEESQKKKTSENFYFWKFLLVNAAIAIIAVVFEYYRN